MRERVRVHAEHDADRLLARERDPVPAVPVQLGPGVQGQLRLHGHQRRLPSSSTSRTRRTRSRSTSTRAARPRQGDVVVYGNILVRSWDSATSAAGAATQSCGGTLVGQGFEGIHIFDITDPTNPVMVDVGNDPPTASRACASRRRTCRARAAARTRRPPCRTRPAAPSTSTTAARQRHLHAASTSSRSRSRTRPSASYVKQAPRGQLLPRQHRVPQRRRQLRDRARAATASRMFKFDATIDPTLPGGIENPTLLWSKPMPGVSTGHSGRVQLRRQDGASSAMSRAAASARSCQATSSIVEQVAVLPERRRPATRSRRS